MLIIGILSLTVGSPFLMTLAYIWRPDVANIWLCYCASAECGSGTNTMAACWAAMNYLVVARILAIAAVLALGVVILYDAIEPAMVKMSPQPNPG